MHQFVAGHGKIDLPLRLRCIARDRVDNAATSGPRVIVTPLSLIGRNGRANRFGGEDRLGLPLDLRIQ